MKSVADRVLGMELSEAKSLLQKEGVNFVVLYTEPDRKKDMFDVGEGLDRVIRVKKVNDCYELTACTV